MISKIIDYRRRKCTTVLHRGVCHRTSTQNKSGNKMKGTKGLAHFMHLGIICMHLLDEC